MKNVAFRSPEVLSNRGACPLIHPNYFSVYLGLGLWLGLGLGLGLALGLGLGLRLGRVRVNSVTETNMMTEK